MGDLKSFARESSIDMFIRPEPVLDIFFCYVQLRGLLRYF